MRRELGRAMRMYGYLFLIVLTLTGCGSAQDMSDTDTVSDNLSSSSVPVSSDSNTINYDSQLQLIADHAEMWMGDPELIAEPYFYAVTDLDQNGRLEIIQSSCQGTGLYTYTQLWEVDAAGTALTPCQLPAAEGDSQPDIISDPDMVYFDEARDRYYYIFRDDIRNGAAEHYQNWVAVSLQDGAVTTTLLGQRHSIHLTPDSDEVITYMDANGNTVDEDAYNRAADQTFAGLTAMKATICWSDYTELPATRLDALTEEELMGILETSWAGFSLT